MDISVLPLESYPPLIVDVDTVLALAISFERFQMIAGRLLQIFQRLGAILGFFLRTYFA